MSEWCVLVGGGRVLGLAEIVGLAGTVDGEGRSGVADSVAGVWGFGVGAARFWRSSGSHVFRVGEDFLRFVPAGWRLEEDWVAIAELMEGCADGGLGVARPVRSLRGRYVESVITARGMMVGMLVEGVSGESVGIAELGVQRGWAWGVALGRLHRDGEGDGGLPPAFGDLGLAEHVLGDDPDMAKAVARVRGALDRLPRDSRVYGITHGDFELDNLAWAGSAPTAFDFDDAAHGWFVADIGSALRDLGRAPFEQPVGRAFVEGYCTVRAISADELGWLPLFEVARAIEMLIRLRRALDMAPEAGAPAWVERLHGRLRERVGALRAAVLGSPLLRG